MIHIFDFSFENLTFHLRHVKKRFNLQIKMPSNQGLQEAECNLQPFKRENLQLHMT